MTSCRYRDDGKRFGKICRCGGARPIRQPILLHALNCLCNKGQIISLLPTDAVASSLARVATSHEPPEKGEALKRCKQCCDVLQRRSSRTERTPRFRDQVTRRRMQVPFIAGGGVRLRSVLEDTDIAAAAACTHGAKHTIYSTYW